MSFAHDDRVFIKGDPDQEVFTVRYVNSDESVDLNTSGGEWEYFPTRLLERAPDPVRVGDIYRGNTSGDHYVVVRVANGTVTSYDTGDQRLISGSATNFQDANYYTKVQGGSL